MADLIESTATQVRALGHDTVHRLTDSTHSPDTGWVWTTTCGARLYAVQGAARTTAHATCPTCVTAHTPATLKPATCVCDGGLR